MGGKRITLTSLIGLVGGVACVAIAIAEAGNLSLFINLPSFLIIVGGTICALVLSYPFCTLKTLGSVIRQAFVETSFDPIADINTILELCELSRREGLLAIESRSESINDPFLKRGMNLLVDGSDREYLEATMINEIHQAQKRHKTGASMISMIATLAPGLGLVGTYVGLIPMLVEMNDPDKLGPMMAIELVSSFYGGFLANVIFSPLAKKLLAKSDQEKHRSEMILEGLLGIQAGKNPRALREDLLAYLTKRDAKKIPELSWRKAGKEGGNVINYKERQAKRKGA